MPLVPVSPTRSARLTLTAIGIAVLALAACESQSAVERHWRHCSCTYVSDFDDQSAAPIEVCGDEKYAEEVAAICIRNDGVGVPTGCKCDPRPIGTCAKSDRCRASTDGGRASVGAAARDAGMR